MSEVLARFRDLKGIGPATEARLHEVGIHSWEALATAASALAAVRGGDTAKEVAALVAAHRAEAESEQALRAPAGDGPPGGEPATVVEPVPAVTPAPVSPSRDHLVVLDAGKAIGGAERDIALTVDGLGAVAGAGYRAELCTRRLGDARDDAAWSVAARRSGPVPVGDRGALPLEFGPVRLEAGIHRLQVRLHLQLPRAAARPPVLAVV